MRLLSFLTVTALTLFATEAGNLRGSNTIPAPDCGAPPSVYQGSVKYTSTKVGSSATLTCMKGTQLKGASSTRCSSTGVWSPQIGECRVTYLPSKDNSFKNKDPGYILYSG